MIDLFFFFYSSGHVGYFLESFHHLESTPIPARPVHACLTLSCLSLELCQMRGFQRHPPLTTPIKYSSLPLCHRLSSYANFSYTALHCIVRLFFISLVIVSLHQNVSSKKSRKESWTLGTLRKQQSQRGWGSSAPWSPPRTGVDVKEYGWQLLHAPAESCILAILRAKDHRAFLSHIVYTLPFSLILEELP